MNFFLDSSKKKRAGEVISEKKIKYVLGNKPISKLILVHSSQLHSALARIKIQKKVFRDEDLVEQKETTSNKEGLKFPKYFRVNPFKATVDEIVQKLVLEKWVDLGSSASNTSQQNTTLQTGQNLNKEKNEKEISKENSTEKSNSNQIVSKSMICNVPEVNTKTFYRDPMIPSLLVLPPTIDLHSHYLVKQFLMIAQNKASCFPPLILSGMDGELIDATSAPGNKTIQLAGLCPNQKVYAFEKDFKRGKLLKQRVKQSKATNVEIRVMDFLASNPKEFPKVSGILVDPSCSGSGVHGKKWEFTEERIMRLSAFQHKILCHALKFPNVKKVVYSTCSIRKEENEDVVAKTLEASHVKGVFKLKRALKNWKRRGIEPYQKCVRCSHDDLTIGFFVACFERIQQNLDQVKKRRRTNKKKEKIIKNKEQNKN
eukprot:Anaeramoba_flamelloidesa1055038_30.p1 GENE.a1055038_30~~a1055038_30.p1  ORF type:complete len:428 (+),score=111.28 a1055038_30:378-1661(+)